MLINEETVLKIASEEVEEFIAELNGAGENTPDNLQNAANIFNKSAEILIVMLMAYKSVVRH